MSTSNASSRIRRASVNQNSIRMQSSNSKSERRKASQSCPPPANDHDNNNLVKKRVKGYSSFAIGFHGYWRRTYSSLQRMAKHRPEHFAKVLVIVVFTFTACVIFGILMVIYLSRNVENSLKVHATQDAESLFNNCRYSLINAVQPLAAFQALVAVNRNATVFTDAYFNEFAEELILGTEHIIETLQLAPNAVVSHTYPLAGNEKSIGHNLLAESQPPGTYQGVNFTYPSRRAATLTTIAFHKTYITGPTPLVQGYVALVARRPLWIENASPGDTFGLPYGLTNCTTLCYDATIKEKLWGLSSSVMKWDKISSIFTAKADSLKYNYELYNIDAVSQLKKTLLASPTLPSANAIDASFSYFNLNWHLRLEPEKSWTPSWRDGMLAGVILISFFFSLLTLLFLIGYENQQVLLESILPTKVIRALERGERFEEHFDNVAILFADIVGYTSLSMKLHPKQIAELLDELYFAFDELCSSNMCFKLETIGDCFVCVAGAPEDTKNPRENALNIVHMARDMIEHVNDFVSSSGHRIKIRIGVNCGPVVASVVDSKVPRYCLFGDTINTTARMETNSQPLRVNCSSEIFNMLSGIEPRDMLDFTFEPRGSSFVKGKGFVDMYFVNFNRRESKPTLSENSDTTIDVEAVTVRASSSQGDPSRTFFTTTYSTTQDDDFDDSIDEHWTVSESVPDDIFQVIFHNNSSMKRGNLEITRIFYANFDVLTIKPTDSAFLCAIMCTLIESAVDLTVVNVDKLALHQFISACSIGYNPNSYHNFRHATVSVYRVFI